MEGDVVSDGVNDLYTAIIEVLEIVEDAGLKPSTGALLVMATSEEPSEDLSVYEFAVKAGTEPAIVTLIARGHFFESGFGSDNTVSTVLNGWLSKNEPVDFGNDCVHCGQCTSFGGGLFVNRIPFGSDKKEGYVCEPCQEGGADELREEVRVLEGYIMEKMSLSKMDLAEIINDRMGGGIIWGDES
jgi:hypothetical protein